MKISKKNLKKIFYDHMMKTALLHESYNDKTVPGSRNSTETLGITRTQYSTDNEDRITNVPFDKAEEQIRSVPNSRKIWIDSNLDNLDPLPGGDLTNSERIYYFMKKIEIITSDIASKTEQNKKDAIEKEKIAAKKREEDNLAYVARIKQMYKDKPGDYEPTGVIMGKDSESTIPIGMFSNKTATN